MLALSGAMSVFNGIPAGAKIGVIRRRVLRRKLCSHLEIHGWVLFSNDLESFVHSRGCLFGKEGGSMVLLGCGGCFASPHASSRIRRIELYW
jgi:hypothetical protein